VRARSGCDGGPNRCGGLAGASGPPTNVVRLLLQPSVGYPAELGQTGSTAHCGMSFPGRRKRRLRMSPIHMPLRRSAFVGASANAVQSSAPTWIGSGVIYVGTTFQGAGVIDATPTYSFQAPGAASALAATATAGAPAGVNRLADVGLTEFNRLTEAPVAHAEREVSGALYTVSAQPRPVRDLRPAAAIDDSPAPARPAQRVQRTAYNKRFCTVTEVMHAASASCR